MANREEGWWDEYLLNSGKTIRTGNISSQQEEQSGIQRNSNRYTYQIRSNSGNGLFAWILFMGPIVLTAILCPIFFGEW